MKKTLIILALVLFVFSSCEHSGFAESEFTQENIVGKWEIVQARKDKKWGDISGSFYTFRSNGIVTLKISGENVDLKYKVQDGYLYEYGSDGSLYFKFKIEHLCDNDMTLLMLTNKLTNSMLDYKFERR